MWRRRNLTPIGKITVIKSLLLSKLVHLFTALPSPSQAELKEVECLFFSFLWGGKRDPIKRAKIIQDYLFGGLRMVDVQAFVKSMKLTWLKRLMISNAEWVQLVDAELPNIQDVLNYGSIRLQKMSTRIHNQFWKDVINAFAWFSREYKPDALQILNESLWFSDHTKFKCSIIHEWNLKGLRHINDLVSETTGRVHTKESLEGTFGIRMTILCYTSLMRSLPESVKTTIQTKTSGPIIPLRMNLVMNHPNFTHFAYSTYDTISDFGYTSGNFLSKSEHLILHIKASLTG